MKDPVARKDVDMSSASRLSLSESLGLNAKASRNALLGAAEVCQLHVEVQVQKPEGRQRKKKEKKKANALSSREFATCERL